jgi:transglutaminase-like putative cysteine protease
MRTLETMSTLARQGRSDPGVSTLVASIRAGVGDSVTGFPFVMGVDRYLRDIFVYREEDNEVLRDVPFMLNDLATMGHMEGDCDDMTIMGCALLSNAGLLCRMTAIKSSNEFEYDHVFSEVRIGATWIPVDPTVPVGTQYETFGFMSEPV